MIGLAVVRADVHAALVTGLTGLLPAGSVHPTIPDELALPAVWVDSPIGMRPSDPATVVASVDVVIAVDGAEHAQLAALDDLESAVWVALEQVGVATLAIGSLLAVGGPNVHAVTVSADVDVDVHTLCPPALEAVS